MKQFFMLLKVLKHISYLYKGKKTNNMCHTDTIWVFFFLCFKLYVFLVYLCNVYAYLIMIATRNATHYSPCPLGLFRKIIKNYL